MTANVTNSKSASLAKLASDFGKIETKLIHAGGKAHKHSEVRARKEGNVMVLYVAPRGNFVQRRFADIFSGRQHKLNVARECVKTMLERYVPSAKVDHIMSIIRTEKNHVSAVHQAVIAARNAELKNS